MAKKKAITLIVALALCVGCFAGCTPVEDPEEVRITLSWKTSYASMMQFDSFAGTGMRLSASIDHERYTDLVLVMSKAESAGYDENVMVAWPSEKTEEILHRLNQYVTLENKDVTYNNLTYPITMSDVVENWQDVGNLIGRMDNIYEILKP
ncbi:MAG: hypothetical protein LBG68_00535 [Coriobacteriales bacterium]|jgi:hypothetical protein|nr:hypothetical protein [Coriobacteriales bacterium]